MHSPKSNFILKSNLASLLKSKTKSAKSMSKCKIFAIFLCFDGYFAFFINILKTAFLVYFIKNLAIFLVFKFYFAVF